MSNWESETYPNLPMVSLRREVQKVSYHLFCWCYIGESGNFERLVTQYSRCRMAVWIWIRISDRVRHGKSASFSWSTDGNNSRNAIPNASKTHCWYSRLCSRTNQWVKQSHPISSHLIFPDDVWVTRDTARWVQICTGNINSNCWRWS